MSSNQATKESSLDKFSFISDLFKLGFTFASTLGENIFIAVGLIVVRHLRLTSWRRAAGETQTDVNIWYVHNRLTHEAPVANK